MTIYSTAYTAHSLGRWLATLAVSLVLLALAYAHAPDPAEYLGLSSPGARFTAELAPALAATQLNEHPGPTR